MTTTTTTTITPIAQAIDAWHKRHVRQMRALTKQLKKSITIDLIATCSRCQREQMDTITARWTNVNAPPHAKPVTVLPEKFPTKTLPAHRAYGADTWRVKGGMMGGVASHLGTVPQAFFR